MIDDAAHNRLARVEADVQYVHRVLGSVLDRLMQVSHSYRRHMEELHDTPLDGKCNPYLQAKQPQLDTPSDVETLLAQIESMAEVVKSRDIHIKRQNELINSLDREIARRCANEDKQRDEIKRLHQLLNGR